MIQVIGLRPYIDANGKEKLKHELFLEIKNVDMVFNDINRILHNINANEHWNLYYTAADCKDSEEGLRLFNNQYIIPFDIDDIDCLKNREYIPLICDTLEIDKTKTGIIATGNGLQFIIKLKDAFTDEKFFETHKRAYKNLCGKINMALKKADLPGHADPVVWSKARLLRLPNTKNIKKTKGTKNASLIRKNLETQEFKAFTENTSPGDPKLNDLKKSSKSQDFIETYPKPDTKAILGDCEFLRYCKENQSQVTEPQWYAMLSILSRLDDSSLPIEYSKNYPGFTVEELQDKLTQAEASSGPRTCSNIDSLWTGCEKCKHHGKLTSPILIKGPEHIATKDNGFHTIIANGGSIKVIPCYEDLRKYFNQTYIYKTLAPGKMCYVFNGTHYEFFPDQKIDNFAQTNFRPYAKNTMINEFRQLVLRTNLADPQFFSESIKHKINFPNGVLNFKTGELLPHSPDYGFRYVLPYAYEPEADCPRFKQFLKEVTGNDEEVIKVILEFMGYCLSGDKNWLHKAWILVGEGRNGKSTLLDVLRRLGGDGNHTALTVDALKRDINRQLLDGKLFNISEETPDKSLTESSLFKNLVSGGVTPVRMLFKDPYFIRNFAKMIFTCNTLPPTRDTTEGFNRRLLIVRFEQDFKGREEFEIDDRLEAELSGIFNLCLEAYKRLKVQKKFTQAKSVSKQIDEYTLEQDTVRQWIDDDNIEVNGDWSRHTAIREIYSNYKLFTEQNGFYALNSIAFGRQLSKQIEDYKERMLQTRISGKKVRVLRGVLLNSI